MADEPTKWKSNEFGYDPIEEDELIEDPVSASHVDLPDPDDVFAGGDEDPELRKRKQAARDRKRRREAELDHGLEGDVEPSTAGDKAS